MACGDWTEHGVVWDDVAGDDRTMDDTSRVSCVDDFEGRASYDINVLWARPR